MFVGYRKFEQARTKIELLVWLHHSKLSVASKMILLPLSINLLMWNLLKTKEKEQIHMEKIMWFLDFGLLSKI